MNSFIQIIKNLLPVSVKARAKYYLSPSSDSNYDCYRGKKKAVIALAADYGNLGDIAITFAQNIFLKSYLQDYEIIDFPISSTFTQLKALRKIIDSQDLVTIIGGGNMGDLYGIEDCRRFVIEKFQKNRIISFPQTMDFSNSTIGKRELQKTIKVYGSHKNLHLFARESISYDRMKKHFPNNHVYLVPDIVLSLNKSQPQQQRQGVLFCIRNDYESAFSAEDRSVFLSRISSALPDHSIVDTHIGRNGLTVQESEAELLKIWNSFKTAKVVITDRLHGMIFAAITGSPCVVLQNNNHKIKATYEDWLRSFNNIRMQNDFDADETIRLVNEVRNCDLEMVQLLNFTEHFEALKNVIIGN